MKTRRTISVGTNPEIEPLFISRNKTERFWEFSVKTPLKMPRLSRDSYGAGEGI